MKIYSPFFKTLHDEQGPTGTTFGRGTHYSILRAVVFHDSQGKPLSQGCFLDFAIIWDEDHDDRVIAPIEKLYFAGLLPQFLMFGERKGDFTAVRANDGFEGVQSLDERLNEITQDLEINDVWTAEITTLEDSNIVSASAQNVYLYVKNLMMLWELGVKDSKYQASVRA